MSEADYYPPGAYTDPNAPWNQVEPPLVNFNCCVSYTLERNSSLETDEVFYDDSNPGEAYWDVCAGADLFSAYEWDRPSIPEMLDELVKYIDKELTATVDRKRRDKLMQMRESAEGWKIVERDIEIT